MKTKVLFFLLALTTYCKAQVINIPDLNFKAKLLSASSSNTIASIETASSNGNVATYNSIDLNGDGEIQFSEAQNIKWLRISISNITNLTGIEAFINLEYLDCRANQLTTLDISQNTNLIHLNCIQNRLTTLDVTQNTNLSILSCSQNQLAGLDVTQNTTLTELYCYENPITDLNVSRNPNLNKLYCYSISLTALNVSQNQNLTHLICYDNLLSSLNVTSNTSLQHLVCDRNQLPSLDVTQNPSLTYLNCGQNLITTLDITQNINLTQIVCRENQLTALNVSQNTNLNWLDCNQNLLTTLDVSQFANLYELLCNNNQLSTLDVTQNLNLSKLNCTNNLLTTLFLKNSNDCWCFSGQVAGSVLNFSNNPSLQYICTDEKHVAMIQQKIIDYGYATTCHVNSYCSFSPGGTFYTISGVNHFDSDSNGCDANDGIYPFLKYEVNDGTILGNFNTNGTGNYFYDVQAGSHTITPVLENPNYFNIIPTSFVANFPTQTSPLVQDFCVTANGAHHDVEVTIIPTNPARPGFEANYTIIYKNKGNQVENGAITLAFDDAVLDLISTNSTLFNQEINSLVWNYTNLQSLETRTIDLVFNVNSPMETPAIINGDILNYTASIITLTTDEFVSDNASTLNQTVVGSYDPNDKTCVEGTTVGPDMIGKYVHYVIRFENTGTFVAENVVIKDLIDLAKFDVNTLIPLHSSHDFVTRIAGSKVEFIFEGINLPFDDANNDGYVSFKIKTKPNLVVGNTFSNSANIYFDYNFPIATNSYTTTIQNPLGVQENDFMNNISVYPNPVKDILNFKAKHYISKVEIYDIAGRVLSSNSVSENKMDLSELKTGNYILKLYTEKGIINTKIIKE